jgi:lipid-A-disaccharide synthase
MSRKRILIVSGEPSGDLHASNLVKDLKKLNPDLEFFGMGGVLSKNAGVEIDCDITAMALVGLVEVLRNIITVGKAFRGLLKKADSGPVDLAILIDYPGFNLRLAGELKKRGIPVIYYISPQVWAWGADRVKIIKRCVEKILVFFKFEEDIYKNCGVNAEFVGHPLLDTVKVTSRKEETLKKYGLDEKKLTIALLPGSRTVEVKTLLPVMVSAARIISEKTRKITKNVQFVVAKHPSLPRGLYEGSTGKYGEIGIAEGDTHNILNACDFAIVASGTATLETAIIGTPLIIVYKANLLTYILYHIVSTIRFLGLVNVIANREIAPELLQYDATPENIARRTVEILYDEKKMSAMRADLKLAASTLGSPGAGPRAARAILSFLQ